MRRATLTSIVSLLYFSCIASAQIDCVWPAPLHVSRLAGQVVDSSGEPIPDATLTLRKDDEIVQTVKTDGSGGFQIKAPGGIYQLRAEMKYFDPLRVEVHLGNDTYHFLHPSFLHVILSLRGVSCTWATTSKSEFREEIQRYKKRTSGNKENNATQK